MSTTRKPRYFWPPWTNQSEALVSQRLSKGCRSTLILVAKAISEVNGLVLKGILMDRKHYRRFDEDDTVRMFKLGQVHEGHIAEVDASTLESAYRLRIPGPDGDLTELLILLSNTSYLYHLAKQRALDILDLRNEAAEHFESIQEELRRQELDVCDGVTAKLKILERFTTIYNRQPAPSTMDHSPESEPHYHLYPIAGRGARMVVSEAYSQLQRNRNSTLIAIVPVVTLVSVIPMVLAWRRSSNTSGSTTDVDFWLLIQSSTMQLLGLFTTIHPLHRRSAVPAWRWAQTFTIVESICAIAAIPLYLYIPTMWSAVVSFFGSSA